MISADSIVFATVDIYDVNTETWTSSVLSTARIYLAAAAVGSKIIFAGGSKYVL